MKNQNPILKPGVNCFTWDELISRAAKYKGLVAKESRFPSTHSESFATYKIDRGLVDFLRKKNINIHPRGADDGILTLADDNHQVRVPGFASSNYWNFKLSQDAHGKNNIKLSLSVELCISIKDRGITFRPRAYGTFVSPSDNLPHFRMFKALVESGQLDVPAVAKELAESEGYTVVSWTELSLGGIRRLFELFEEFTDG